MEITSKNENMNNNVIMNKRRIANRLKIKAKNYKLTQKIYGSEDISDKAKEAKEYIQNLIDPDILGLKNVKAEQIRAELVKQEFDFIVSRAVTNMPDFVSWVDGKIAKKQNHELDNGILYLKGGDLTEELKDFPKATKYNLSDFFTNEFFETKKVVHLPLKYKK